MSPQARHGARVTEATVRRSLMKTFKTSCPTAVTIRHEDLFTKGIPDLSVSYDGKTSWWEIKYANPSCTTTKIQQFVCDDLNDHGFLCRYIIFREDPRQIRVVHPHAFRDWKTTGLVISEGAFDYQALVDYIKRIHTS